MTINQVTSEGRFCWALGHKVTSESEMKLLHHLDVRSARNVATVLLVANARTVARRPWPFATTALLAAYSGRLDVGFPSRAKRVTRDARRPVAKKPDGIIFAALSCDALTELGGTGALIGKSFAVNFAERGWLGASFLRFHLYPELAGDE